MGRATRPEDLTRYAMLSRPSLSPDGKRIAVSVHRANLESDAYDSDIWIIDADGKKRGRFTQGSRDRDPVWSPDGGSILFSSKRNIAKEGKGDELFVIPTGGGEARSVVKREEGLEQYEWSPDSSAVYFVSPLVEREESDVKVVRRMGLWSNGRGFVHNQRRHAFVARLSTGKARQVTDGEIDVTGIRVSPDGRKLAYLASSDELKPHLSDLVVLDLKTGRKVKVTEREMEIGSMCWSPDGSSIALVGNKLTSGFASHDHVWIAPCDGSSRPRRVDRSDRSCANSLNSDVRSKSHGPGGVIWDGDQLYHIVQEGGSARLCRTGPEGSTTPLINGKSVEGMDVRRGRVAFVAMDSSHLEEIYVAERGERKVSSFNSATERRLGARAHRRFSFRASDGAAIEGWAMLPEGRGRCPAVLYVHGGPKTAFGEAFLHEFQCFASAGYAVVYCNPRGSDGYSERFADIRGAYGKRDFQDVMEALDHALKRFPRIDGGRVAIAGGSYGGFMTNWAIGHTNRFRAAVTDRSVSSWVSFFGTSDIGPQFGRDQTGGDPWEGEERMLEASPLRYAKSIRTPLLIIHSLEDYRCWMVEGLQLFTALKSLGREVEMVLFPGENHDLSRTGRPRHRVERLRHYIRWLDAHLPERGGLE